MVEESRSGEPVNVGKWLDDVKDQMKPPVCNAIMAGGFLKIMFVGGPNVRRDFHLEQGEEFFFMLKGDMCLPIMEKGVKTDIHIKEGEVFVLPSRIYHSPQRQADTVGLVIERERYEHETDEVKYYREDDKTILWHKYFHLESLVKDFPPVIKAYFASEAHKTGVPQADDTSVVDETKIKPDYETVVQRPFNLKEWMTTHSDEIVACGKKELFGKGEFKIHIWGSRMHEVKNEFETWIYQLSGESTVTLAGKTSTLNGQDSIIVKGGDSFTLHLVDLSGDSGKDSRCMSVTMDPTATPPN